MKLIIAEKPELGRAIAAAIPGGGRTEQSVIYKGDYAVVWAYGHLLTLKEPEDYDPAYKRWSLAALPLYFPDWDQKPNRQGDQRKGRTLQEADLQSGQAVRGQNLPDGRAGQRLRGGLPSGAAETENNRDIARRHLRCGRKQRAEPEQKS